MMRSSIKKTGAVIFGCITVLTASAQPFGSAYFLEGISNRHRMNPAFMSERNYISIPALSLIGVSAQGNVGLTDFIYKYDDPGGKYELTTFMSSTVGREEFLNRLHPVNRLQINTDVTLLGTGFYGFGGFNTIELVSRSNTNTNLPYELFDFMKTGMDKAEGSSYRIPHVRNISDAYVELALGHAHALNEKLSLGVKFKVLFAGAYADVDINQLDVTLKQDQWEILAQGTLLGSLDGATFKTKEEEKGDRIKGIDVDDPRRNGWGLATDVGLNCQVTEDLALSGAITDLGFLVWKNMLRGATLNEPYLFDGFESIDVDDDDSGSPDDFDKQLDKLGDDLGNLAKFYDQGEITRERRLIAATLHLGAEYTMPFYRGLSAGFLWTTRFHELHTWTEGRLSANLSPSRWFDFSVNYALSNLSTSLGWIINFHPKGINFFVGSDRMVTEVNSQGIPLNDLNGGVILGMNITFGNRRYE